MASSGSFQASCNDYVKYQLSWQLQSQDIANQTSTLKWTLQSVGSLSVGFIASCGGIPTNVTFDSKVVYSGNLAGSISCQGNKDVASGTVTLQHGSDGNKSFAYSFSIQMPSFSVNLDSYFPGLGLPTLNFGPVSGNSTGTLDSIPGPTTPSVSPASVQIGSAVTITLNRASSSFTHNLGFDYAGKTYSFINGVGTSYSWIVPSDIANGITSGTSVKGKLWADTIYNGKSIGMRTCDLEVSINPNAYPPSISNVSVTDPTGIKNNIGTYLQSQSKANITFTASPQMGATIASTTVNVNGQTLSGTNVTSSALTNSGNNTITITVKDSRGVSNSYSMTITVSPYVAPKITKFQAQRANSDGSLNPGGNYMLITMAAEVTAYQNYNTASFTLQYKKSNEGTWTTFPINPTTGNYIVNTTRTLGPLDPDYAYNFQMVVTDRWTTTNSNSFGAADFVLMDFAPDGKSMAFGQASTRAGIAEVSVNMPFDFQSGAALFNGMSFTGGQIKDSTDDYNNYQKSAIIAITSSASNAPNGISSGHMLVLGGGTWGNAKQIVVGNDLNIYIRGYQGNPIAWTAWKTITSS